MSRAKLRVGWGNKFGSGRQLTVSRLANFTIFRQ